MTYLPAQMDFPVDDQYHEADTRAKGYVKLKSRGAKFNPPIHKGCVCHIVPELETRVKGWKDTKDTKEAVTALGNLGLGNVIYDSKKAFVRVMNPIGEDFVRMRDKFPELKRTMSENPLHNGLEVIGKEATLSGRGHAGAVGLYRGDWDDIILSVRGKVTNPVLHMKDMHVGNDVQSLLRHEYGHHIHKGLLGGKRARWFKIYNDRKKSKTWGAISNYASTNMHEAFAESFSAYTSPLYGTTKRRVLPKEIEDFMKDLLGG